MSTETYSLSSDFSGNLNPSKFQSEIEANSGIEPTCICINTNADVVDCVFSTSLTAGEKTTLNALVSSHTLPAYIGTSVMNVINPTDEITDTTLVNVCSFIFPGTSSMNITNVRVISEMEDGGTSFTCCLKDISNNTTIASGTFSNIDTLNNDLGVISNLPADESIFELQVKVTDTTTALIQNINIYYD